ncbi:MAG: ribosome biogenesis GTPase Der, partial [Gammaproteobacteria bacterium]|nr:ribosome biogenesis GTPase Der [Gammaproteobacteria bacterium]
GMKAESRQWLKREIERRLGFVDYAPVHFISALHGAGVGDLYDSIHTARESSGKTVSTNTLTRMLEQIVNASPPPLAQGRRIRLRYAHLGGHNPPLIVIHGKQLDKLPGHYRRYLQNSFRQMLELRGVSVKIELRNDDNPYARGEENLSARQVARKRRIEKNRR